MLSKSGKVIAVLSGFQLVFVVSNLIAGNYLLAMCCALFAVVGIGVAEGYREAIKDLMKILDL
jgi:hypothetical protein